MKKRPEADFSSPVCQPYFAKGDSHAVLLLHGFTGSAAHMRVLAEGLAAQGFTVRSINLPGHATRMDDMRHCTWQDWLNAAKEEFTRLKAEYEFVSVAGLSMGGCLALMLAEQNDPTAVVAISAPMGVQNRMMPLAGVASLFVPEVSWEERKDDALDARYDKGYPGFPTKSAVGLNRIIREARANLCAVTCPVLVVQSDGDETIRPESMQIILDGVSSTKKARLCLKDVPHVCTISREGNRIAQQVGEFLRLAQKEEAAAK